MDGDILLNVATVSTSRPRRLTTASSKGNVTVPTPVALKKIGSNAKSVNKLVVGRAIKIKKGRTAFPAPNTGSVTVGIGGKANAKSDGLKFADEPVSKNPLQVGLSAKQHPAQQELLNLIGEAVSPNIETLFSETSWESFGSKMRLHPHLISVIRDKLHFSHPTSIQVSAIRHLIKGRDALIKAQTGSGKTIAYALPMLHDLITIEPPISRTDGPKVLIILPTRELATQTALIMTQMCRACIRIVPGLLMGGAKRKAEKASLRKGLNIIVSTPRRLLDHLGKTTVLSLKALKWLVIDEADRLVELGFERDVRRIIERVALETTREGSKTAIQTVLLSATLTPGVETLAGLALKNPVKCEANGASTSSVRTPDENKPVAVFSVPSGLKHFLLVVPCKQRLIALAAFLLLKAKYNKRSGKLIVFFATQDCVDFHYRLFSETLCDDDDDSNFKINSLCFYRLHGNMDHKDRQSVFQQFSNSANGILLTTDVASRGLDLAGVAWVVQYHVSGSPVDYIHRVGRTARAGGRGKALLILQPEEESYTHVLSTTVGVQLNRLNLIDVLQTALYHLRHSRRHNSVTTVEEAAANIGRYFLQTVGEDSELLALAERAYISFLRAYASFSGPMRVHFVFKRLHLGHVARAFCLRDAPSDIASHVTGKRPSTKSKSTANDGAAPPATKKSRRLEFDDERGKSSLTRKKIPKPTELATRNMLAEYGL